MNYKKMARRADVLFGYAHWKWNIDGYQKRPSRPRLEQMTRELVAGVEDGASQVEAGRLVAIKNEYGPGDTEIKVCIIIGTEHRG